MSIALIQSLLDVYQDPENQALVNKAHLAFLGHHFIMPVKKLQQENQEPEVLFYTENGNHFLPVFSDELTFKNWASDSMSQMDWLNIMGKDVVLGAGSHTYICLDVGQLHYKEFEPKEVMKLKQATLKLEKIAKASAR